MCNDQEASDFHFELIDAPTPVFSCGDFDFVKIKLIMNLFLTACLENHTEE